MKNKYMDTKNMMRSLLLLLALFFSTSIYSQKSGEEIVRIKKTYYGRNSQNTKKSSIKKNVKTYSGEECFDKGLDMINQQNFTKAMEWLLKGAAQNDGPCELLCGMAYDGGRIASQDFTKAVDYYRKAANKGIKEAMTYLGRCYYDGKGVTKDYNQAYYWYKKAEDLGDSNVYSDLGNYYCDGDAIEPNFEIAAQYYEAAAKAGETRGQYSLAYRYLYGEGKTQNTEMALYWMQKAADSGDVMAMADLGAWYIMDKNGIPVNFTKSLYWLEKAAAAGSDLAIQYLPEVKKYVENMEGASGDPISINRLYSFNIVAGSYFQLPHAQSLCQELRNNKWPAVIYYETTTEFYRVVLFRTNQESEAVELINSSYIKENYPDAWILQVINGQAVKYSK